MLPGERADGDDLAGLKGPKDVQAELLFIRPQASKPLLLSAAYTRGEPKELFEVAGHCVEIKDMRALEHAPKFDQSGFALRDWSTSAEDLRDDVQVDGIYIPELEERIANELGASEVVVFDTTRRSDGGRGAANRDGPRGPASRVHVDYTWASGATRARDVLGAAAFERHERHGRRIVQLNVWRPIGATVRRSPLALADASSVRPENLIATDQLFPDRRGEIYHVSFDPAQRWFYAPEMRSHEVLLIKGWDSLEGGVARFTPHASFKLPDHDTNTNLRESIEARAIAII